MTTNNEQLIEQLVNLCDTHPYALNEKLTADHVVRALLNQATGGAVVAFSEQPDGWLMLQADIMNLITRNTNSEPGDKSWALTLHNVLVDMNDIADNAND